MPPLEQAKEYMVNYPRSNFPPDRYIGEKFNISRSMICRIRNELIKNGELSFKDGRFIPKSFVAKIKK